MYLDDDLKRQLLNVHFHTNLGGTLNGFDIDPAHCLP